MDTHHDLRRRVNKKQGVEEECLGEVPMESQESSQESQYDDPSEGRSVEPIPLCESPEALQPNRKDPDTEFRVIDKTNTYLEEAVEELENLSEGTFDRAADQEGTTFTELREEMHNLREKATKRAGVLKRLKKRVMNGRSTTAAESTMAAETNSDTQTETENENKGGTSRKTQMIKKTVRYLSEICQKTVSYKNQSGKQ